MFPDWTDELASAFAHGVYSEFLIVSTNEVAADIVIRIDRYV